ncbi:MAG: M56 family metallopeptidase [Salinimicrobium sp.]
MELYFLKFAACSSLLFVFYKLLLEQEEMHVFKRIFLPASLLVSAIIPLVTFTEYTEALPAEAGSKMTFLTGNISSEAALPWLPIILWSIYGLGVIFFGIIFIRNFSEILQKIRKNPKIKNGDTIDVLLQEQLPPHTFWSFIFLNRKQHEQKQIPKEVYVHEHAHAVQKHSLDVLLIELLQIVLWFFPLIYFLKKAIKLNHEFLADKAVLKNGMDRSLYQQTLLAWSSNSLQSNLVNPISYLSIKKRFTVMKKRTSKNAFLLRTFLLAPVLLAMLYGFSTTKIVERPLPDSRVIPLKLLQEKATPEMIAEYNAWAKKIKSQRGEKTVDKKELDHMRHIYNLMTAAQKEKAEAFPYIDKDEIIILKEDKQVKRSAKEAKIRDEERAARRQEREEKRAERREIEIERDMERKEREMERAERREIEIERKLEKREREMNRAERREIEIERIEVMEGDPPPAPPAPPAPPVPEKGDYKDSPPPPPPPTPEMADIPAPPPPPSPEEAIKGWIADGAEFYYNGKKVSGEEALKRVQMNNGKNLNVNVRENDSEKVVRIRDNEK